MFWVNVNIDGAEHKLDTLAKNAEDLEKPLAIFGGYLKRRAIRRYEAQSFAPLAESTLEKRANKGLRSMERKLNHDLRKAARRAGGGGKNLLSEVVAQSSRGFKNRAAVLAEFQLRHGSRLSAAGFNASGHLKALSVKQVASLDARTQRAVTRAVGAPILGALAKSLVVLVSDGSMTLKSRTKGEWSEIHNEGGSGANGAQIPERKTVVLEDSDLDVFVSILKSHLLVNVEEGMHGPGF